MNKYIAFLTVFLVLFSLQKAAHADLNESCSMLSNSREIMQFKNTLRDESKIESAWSSFHLSKSTIVFINSENSPKCAVILNNQNIDTLVLDQNIHFDNDLYSILNPYRGSTEPELKELYPKLRAKGIEVGIAIDLGSPMVKKLFATSSSDPNFIKIKKFLNVFSNDVLKFFQYIAFHEGAHAIVQDSNSEFGWVYPHGGMTRSEVQVCYTFNAKVKKLAKEEIESFKRLFAKFLLTKRSIETNDIDLQKFVNIRLSRYKLLDLNNVKSKDSSDNCEKAEADWELIEGSAEYIALSEMLALNIISPSQAFNLESMTLDVPSEDLFYGFGSGMLLMLQKKSGLNMSSKEINTSIFKTFMESFSKK